MAKICPVCEGKLQGKFKTSDGVICANCTFLSANYRVETIDTLKGYWNENQSRAAKFQKSVTLKTMMSESVNIDQTNKFFYVGKEGKVTNPVYYSFDEVSEYAFEQVGGKTVTKSKGGIGRAVVGGALFGGVGAIVGASTSNKETKTVGAVNLLRITLDTH